MTQMTARLSMAALRAQAPKFLWKIFNNLAPALLASREWTKQFTLYACQFRPKPLNTGLAGSFSCNV
eukprot:5804707-Pleurochrysis_carterae.AAC.1